LLLSGDGSKVSAIVDWELSREPAPRELDLYHLLITTRAAVEQRELGDVVAAILGDRTLTRPVRTFTLLAWLHHLAANIEKSNRYGLSRRWIRGNLDPVLAAVAGAHALPRTRGLDTARLGLAAAIAMPALAVVLWLVSLGHMDPRAMTDTGLISVMPATFVAALLALTASFVTLALRGPHRRPLLAAHVVALVAFLHATPSILYGTLRYAWAWKHVGIVDYIQRHGIVTPGIHDLPVYHNWPGFFGLDALLTEFAGLRDTLGIAVWGPLFFNLLDIGAVLFLFSALTRDRRVVWLGTWLFFVANWVGQDYFSPQAFAFLLYLVLLGVVARWLGRGPHDEVSPLRRPAFALAVLLLVAIAASHALTAVMACLALTALGLWRRYGARGIALAAVAITAGWDLVLAADYVDPNASQTLGQIRFPWDTTTSSLTAFGQLSANQALVADIARGLVVTMVALAALGAIRSRRLGSLNRVAVVLAAVPVALFASGNYDGEILFRIYLFAVPFLAFLAAQNFVGARGARPTARRSAAAVAATTILLGAFLVAYYGKERQNYFTPDEVTAARYLYTRAPAGALLIEGTHNYPNQFANYERFEYVTISREPTASRNRVLADPVGVLTSWMAPHPAAFVILTRSQETEVDELGGMPPGSVTRIERALSDSPRFRIVLRNRDAVIFALARTRPGGTVR
ncbi:MAG: hypothetical protein QOG68_1077, partial [Solirubrobacteraceae bacterium]|nr:hypothetical protein [Solirubrobacteraceae bacterium]